VKPRVSQLGQSGATDGQVLTWDTTTSRWQPETPSAGYTDEQARDAIGTALVAGTNVTITVNDGADTITIASTATGGGDSYATRHYAARTWR
jgi:hypothetical protein